MVKNGLVALLHDAVEREALPETDEPLNKHVTGYGVLDSIFVSLIPFFWPALDGKMPGLSLYGFYFGTSVAVVWALVMLEASRAGNRWKPVML